MTIVTMKTLCLSILRPSRCYGARAHDLEVATNGCGEHKGEQHGEEHKEGFADKIKDKIHGEGEKKKKEKKKREHGHEDGHDSSSGIDVIALINFGLNFSFYHLFSKKN